ncbi:hypothetical protein ACJRPK_11700 [Aquimarina sp. 2-A2]|uniref:hypothetical protein n=1 Tax=Aquimarina sp. 2-A2 TaxID=3382644 RepID=UPI00387F09C4
MKKLLKISAVLWIVWGLVHIFAGVMTMRRILTGDISASVAGIADAVEPSLLQMDYSEASGAILSQHGFNLFWIGIFTFIGAFYIWKGNKIAIIFTAIVGGLTDLGYFIFIDLGGFANFVPGTIMTIVSTTAIILSLYVYFNTRNQLTTK